MAKRKKVATSKAKAPQSKPKVIKEKVIEKPKAPPIKPKAPPVEVKAIDVDTIYDESFKVSNSKIVEFKYSVKDRYLKVIHSVKLTDKKNYILLKVSLLAWSELKATSTPTYYFSKKLSLEGAYKKEYKVV